MKILLTGSHGFIGTHLRNELNARDHEVISWDKKIGRDIDSLSVGDFVEVDAVVHLAGYISVPESYKSPEEYFINNAYFTLRLIDRAVKAGVKKFIFSSSSSVYGDPLSPYGASKSAAEKALDCYRGQIELSILRFFNVYGPGQGEKYPNVITHFARALQNNEPLQIYGDGKQKRDFTYVKDICRVILNILDQEQPVDKPFDVCKGESISIIDLVGLMTKIWGKETKINFLPKRPEIKDSKGDPTIVKRYLANFTPLEEGLRGLYEAINNNNNN